MIQLDGAAILIPREFPRESRTEIHLAKSTTERTAMGWTLILEQAARRQLLRVDPLGLWLRFSDEWRSLAHLAA